MLFHQHEEYDCPLPLQCIYCLRTQRRIRQLWQRCPNTALRDRRDSSFAANQKSSSQFSCSVREPRTASFPALLPLMHFSSITRTFPGMKVRCQWHKYRRNKRVEGCCWHLTNSARISNSSLHKIPCAEAVNGKQVDYIVCCDPVKQFWCRMTYLYISIVLGS